MREIKFRGYSNGLHTWIYGDLQTPIKNNNLPFIRQFDKDEWFSVDENSIGQYTGFEDRSGKEIYEGDILIDNFGLKQVVKYEEEVGTWQTYEINDKSDRYDLYMYNEMCKVIGNIYEKKEKQKVG